MIFTLNFRNGGCQRNGIFAFLLVRKKDELQNFLPCCIQKKAVANFDRLSDGNDDFDTQKRINEQ